MIRPDIRPLSAVVWACVVIIGCLWAVTRRLRPGEG